MKKKLVVSVLVVAFIVLAIIFTKTVLFNNASYSDDKLITISANTPDDATMALSEQLFKSGYFEGVSISDFQLLDYIQLKAYNDLTKVGNIFSYELLYKFKTDDDRAFIENKITGKPVATNVWLDDVVARRCIVLFEYENVYYKLFNWDEISFKKSFTYNNGEYGSSNFSFKDWLECNIIKAVFDNPYNISALKISETPPIESIKNKLHRDIEILVNPNYQIDTEATKVYNLTFDEEIKCIYFNADLYDIYGNEIVKDKGLSLFLNGGFSIYDIENIIPSNLGE